MLSDRAGVLEDFTHPVFPLFLFMGRGPPFKGRAGAQLRPCQKVRTAEKMNHFVTERLEPKENFLLCPNCNGFCVELYKDWLGYVVGCNECIREEHCPEGVECPICGENADTLYLAGRKPVGCNNCIKTDYEN